MHPIERAAVELLVSGIPDSHYAAIGKVAANWSVLEKLIDSACWLFARIDDEPGACLTSQIYTLDGRLKALISILRWREADKEMVGRFNAFMEDMRGIQEQRNRVVHDPWVGDDASGTPHRLQITAQRTLVMGYKPMPTDDVDAVCERIFAAINRFVDDVQELIRRLGEPPPASP